MKLQTFENGSYVLVHPLCYVYRAGGRS